MSIIVLRSRYDEYHHTNGIFLYRVLRLYSSSIWLSPTMTSIIVMDPPPARIPQKATPTLFTAYFQAPPAPVVVPPVVNLLPARFTDTLGRELPYWCVNGWRYRLITPSAVSNDAARDPAGFNVPAGNGNHPAVDADMLSNDGIEQLSLFSYWSSFLPLVTSMNPLAMALPWLFRANVAGNPITFDTIVTCVFLPFF